MSHEWSLFYEERASISHTDGATVRKVRGARPVASCCQAESNLDDALVYNLC